MKLFRRSLSRAEAIERAIDISDPGDEVWIHQVDCTNANICSCKPTVIYVGGEPAKAPLGFRIDRDRPPESEISGQA